LHLPRLPTATPGEYSWPGATIYLSSGQYLAVGEVVRAGGPTVTTLPVRSVPADTRVTELGQIVLESFSGYRHVPATQRGQVPNIRTEMARLTGHETNFAFRRNSLSINMRVIDGLYVEARAWETEQGRQVTGSYAVKDAKRLVTLDAEAIGQGVLDTMLLSRLDGLTAEQSMAKISPEPPIQDIPTPTAAMYRTGVQYLIAGDIAVAGGSRQMTTPIRVLPDDATPTQLGQAALDSFESFRVETGDGSEHPDGYRELKKLTGHSSDVAFRRETLMIRLHGTNNTVRLTAALTETKQGKAGFVNFEDLPARLPLEAATLGQGMLDTLQLARFRSFTPQESITKLQAAK